jgi:dTDP-4-dehydrorhamnose reductase
MALAWITGANGLIGNYILRTANLHAIGWETHGITRSDFDLCDFESARKAFNEQKPGLIIHCAAMSKSPSCQANPSLAWKVNVEATQHLAELAHEIPFVFFSTDLVFDGCQGNYDETAAVNPLSVYAETKVAAETIVLRNPNHTVVRTSLNGGTSPTADRGFNEEMRRVWQDGRTINLFTDEFRSPIPAIVTARAIWELVAANKPGLYHVAGRERMSRWQIGEAVATRWPQLNPTIKPGSLKEYQGAPRPPDTSLNCAKAQALLRFPLPGLSDWLVANPNEMF